MTKEKKYAAESLEKRFSGDKENGTHRKRVAQKAAFIGQKSGKTPEAYASRPGKDFARRRALGFEKVVLLLLTMGSESMGKNLMKVSRFQEKKPSAPAFVQQRKKLLPEALEALFRGFTNQLHPEKKYCGYRLFAVDGSSLKSAAYPQDPLSYIPGTNRQHGWNKHHINALFDLENGIYTDIFVQKERQKNENKALCEMADRAPVSGPVIVLADRNYGSLNNLAHLENRGWNYVIRLKERDSVFGVQLPDSSVFDVPVILTLGRLSKRQLEKAGAPIPENYCHITSQRTFDLLPVGSSEIYTLRFRIVRIETSDGKTETLITNLNLRKFPPDELKMLYAKRWGIETSFRSLKYTVGLIHLHSKIPMLVLQEIFAAFLLFNFTKAVSWSVETPQDLQKGRQRLNFSDAVFACCRFLRRSVKNLEALLCRKRLSMRPGRAFPRHFSPGNRISCFYLSSR